MKSLSLLRHAKSSWKNRRLTDAERPLKQRGKRDCQLIGETLKQRDHLFGTVFCSSALRARQTIVAVLNSSGFLELEWEVDDDLYEFDSRRLLKWIRLLDDKLDKVLIVGHNPALTDLCDELAGEDIDNLPTCGFADLECDVAHWRDVEDGCAQLVSLVTPSMLRLRTEKPDDDWYR